LLRYYVFARDNGKSLNRPSTAEIAENISLRTYRLEHGKDGKELVLLFLANFAVFLRGLSGQRLSDAGPP
jgi:hypothetical protein